MSLKKNMDEAESKQTNSSKASKIRDSILIVKKREAKAESKSPQQWEEILSKNLESNPILLKKTYFKTKIQMEDKYKIWKR